MQPNKPTKEAVRSYTQQRTREKSPPPTPEQIRRQLGWGLVGEIDRTPEVPRTA